MTIKSQADYDWERGGWNDTNWTRQGSVQNSSGEFEYLIDEVVRIMHNSFNVIDRGALRSTAGVIMAHLAHVYHLAPSDLTLEDWKARDAARGVRR